MDKDLICPFCHNNNGIMGDNSNFRFSIDWDNDLRVDYGDDSVDFIGINYCPMCGRNLKEEEQ